MGEAGVACCAAGSAAAWDAPSPPPAPPWTTTDDVTTAAEALAEGSEICTIDPAAIPGGQTTGTSTPLGVCLGGQEEIVVLY